VAYVCSPPRRSGDAASVLRGFLRVELHLFMDRSRNQAHDMLGCQRLSKLLASERTLLFRPDRSGSYEETRERTSTGATILIVSTCSGEDQSINHGFIVYYFMNLGSNVLASMGLSAVSIIGSLVRYFGVLMIWMPRLPNSSRRVRVAAGLCFWRPEVLSVCLNA
jgi:hypothetical protein